MLEALFGSVIIEFIGVSVKWIFHSINGLLFSKETMSFSEIWHGGKNLKHSESFMIGVSNILIGYISIAVLIAIGFLINHFFFE